MGRASARLRRRRTETAAQLVGAVLAAHDLSGPLGEHQIAAHWTEIVGERVAARAQPDGVDDGVLRVRVVSSAWLHELSFMREPILARVHQLLGGRALVRDVRFHIDARPGVRDAASVRRRAYVLPMRPRLPPPTPAQLAEIETESRALEDEGLRSQLVALRRRIGL